VEIGEDTAKFIGILALALHEYGLAIHEEALQKLLQARGLYNEHDVSIEKVVAAASRYWEHRDPGISHGIASAFLGPEHASRVDATQALATV
jgi:hypothetical protein